MLTALGLVSEKDVLKKDFEDCRAAEIARKKRENLEKVRKKRDEENPHRKLLKEKLAREKSWRQVCREIVRGGKGKKDMLKQFKRRWNRGPLSLICEEPGCEQKFKFHGYLRLHKNLVHRHGDQRYRCSEEGCGKEF